MPRSDRPSGEFEGTGLFSGSEEDIRARLRKKMKADRDPDSPERREADKRAAFERDDVLVAEFKDRLNDMARPDIDLMTLLATSSINVRSVTLLAEKLDRSANPSNELIRRETVKTLLGRARHKEELSFVYGGVVPLAALAICDYSFSKYVKKEDALRIMREQPGDRMVNGLVDSCIERGTDDIAEAVKKAWPNEADSIVIRVAIKGLDKATTERQLVSVCNMILRAGFQPKILEHLQRKFRICLEQRDWDMLVICKGALELYIRQNPDQIEPTDAESMRLLNTYTDSQLDELAQQDKERARKNVREQVVTAIDSGDYDTALSAYRSAGDRKSVMDSPDVRSALMDAEDDVISKVDISGCILLLRRVNQERNELQFKRLSDSDRAMQGARIEKRKELLEKRFLAAFRQKYRATQDIRMLEDVSAALVADGYETYDLRDLVSALANDPGIRREWVNALERQNRVNELIAIQVEIYNYASLPIVRELESPKSRSRVLFGLDLVPNSRVSVDRLFRNDDIDISVLIECGADLFNQGRFQDAIKLMLKFGATMEDMREAANQRIEYILENITDPNFLLSAEAYEAGYLFDLLYNEDMVYDRQPSHVRRYIGRISRLIQDAVSLDFDNETRRAEREGGEPENSDDRISHPYNMLVWQYVRAAIVSSVDKQVPDDVRILVRNALQERDAYTFLSMAETANARPGRLDPQRFDAEVEVTFAEVIRIAVFDAEYSAETGHGLRPEENPRLLAGRDEIHAQLLKTRYGAAQLVLLYAEDRYTTLDLLQSARNNGITFADIRETLRKSPYSYASSEQLEAFITNLGIINVQVRE